MTSLENIKFDLPFEVPEIKAEYVPYAYVVFGLALLFVVKRPSTVLSLLSSYYTIKNLMDQAKKDIQKTS